MKEVEISFDLTEFKKDLDNATKIVNQGPDNCSQEEMNSFLRMLEVYSGNFEKAYFIESTGSLSVKISPTEQSIKENFIKCSNCGEKFNFEKNRYPKFKNQVNDLISWHFSKCPECGWNNRRGG